MQKGKWKITSNYVVGKKMYAVYRLKDINGIDHSGNREYATEWFDTREEAEEALKKIENGGI